ncbi:hypothetical protein DXC81_09520 [Collinsella tanakaei]|uniref:Uncharacterized protein n=1 Tax=Collinsella tanakaei TaxID=626935 RepID=A0A3E4QPD6_9ACTN|nr:hypothetical protein [Collinsella tanakaei]RGL08159.1 hypothetical protein DXC81_09520 [Collinsella tanakaei]
MEFEIWNAPCWEAGVGPTRADAAAFATREQAEEAARRIAGEWPFASSLEVRAAFDKEELSVISTLMPSEPEVLGAADDAAPEDVESRAAGDPSSALLGTLGFTLPDGSPVAPDALIAEAFGEEWVDPRAAALVRTAVALHGAASPATGRSLRRLASDARLLEDGDLDLIASAVNALRADPRM